MSGLRGGAAPRRMNMPQRELGCVRLGTRLRTYFVPTSCRLRWAQLNSQLFCMNLCLRCAIHMLVIQHTLLDPTASTLHNLATPYLFQPGPSSIRPEDLSPLKTCSTMGGLINNNNRRFSSVARNFRRASRIVGLAFHCLWCGSEAWKVFFL